MYKLTLFCILLFICNNASAQAQERDPFRDADGNSWHQLHLDIEAGEILELIYLNPEEPAEGIISPDGKSVLLKNYPGNRAVKVRYTDKNGSTQELSKGKCFIDPVLQYL